MVHNYNSRNDSKSLFIKWSSSVNQKNDFQALLKKWHSRVTEKKLHAQFKNMTIKH